VAREAEIAQPVSIHRWNLGQSFELPKPL